VRALIQRVLEARVRVAERVVGEIGAGMLVLVGVGIDDSPDDAEWLARKLAELRIFDDAEGVMNRSVVEIGGAVLAVSQFTLHASTRKGNRPSWSRAAPPDIAKPLFDMFVGKIAERLGKRVPTGVFGAHMEVALINDGPVTIWLDSRARE
jgi:D-tyrosyl-tRNA(Tyr) deacylase